MASLLHKFCRKKVVNRDETSTELHRVLTTMDLTMLGIGSTLGIGVYVLAGSVAKESAGPAVVISFFVAAFASVLAGLCYAEFGARVPKAGSAYVYSYVCVGELIAFIVGWNLIMEYVIGVASVAKGYSGYVDSLTSHALSNTMKAYVPIHLQHLSQYFDGFAFAITLLLTLLLAFGVKESSLFNNIFTVLNLGVVLFVIIAGSVYAKPENWALNKDDIFNRTNFTAEQVGEGGFAPFGFHGIMKGAATCFYGFVGFDCVATTGEEAKNPQRAIPLAIIFSLIFIFLSYFGISTVITMMVPYYLQDAEAPLPQAFASVGFSVGQWVVTIGALFGLSTSLLGAMFPMPRVIYAMASDGVLFKFLATVHPRFQTPVIATVIAGTFGGLMAALFQLEVLIDMMSIGTLTAYTLVAVCVLCLRYRKDVDGADDNSDPSAIDDSPTLANIMKQIFNCDKKQLPTTLSSGYTDFAVLIYCIFTILFCAVAIFGEADIVAGNILVIVILAVFGVSMIIILISLSCQPVSRVKLSFRVPLVPLIPGFSIMANTYLVMKLSGMTWIRFAVWMAIGFLIYGICLLTGTTDRSYKASLENHRKRRYSKVSASGIDNPGLDLDSDSELKNQASTNETGKEKPLIKSIQNGKRETIEKSLDFLDEEETASANAKRVSRSVENVAGEAVDSVISQACITASLQKANEENDLETSSSSLIDLTCDQSDEASTISLSEREKGDLSVEEVPTTVATEEATAEIKQNTKDEDSR